MIKDTVITEHTVIYTYRRPSWFRRLCKKLNAHPIEVLILLVASGYVGVLIAQCVRHAAFGVW
jgi:hypothetical protein